MIKVRTNVEWKENSISRYVNKKMVSWEEFLKKSFDEKIV